MFAVAVLVLVAPVRSLGRIARSLGPGGKLRHFGKRGSSTESGLLNLTPQ
jgi:hypothetical protein